VRSSVSVGGYKSVTGRRGPFGFASPSQNTPTEAERRTQLGYFA
jgi:hypothetical protein